MAETPLAEPRQPQPDRAYADGQDYRAPQHDQAYGDTEDAGPGAASAGFGAGLGGRLGVEDPAEARKLRLGALGLGLAWLALAYGAWSLALGTDPGFFAGLLALLALAGPLVLLWLALGLTRRARDLAHEVERLRGALDSPRQGPGARPVRGAAAMAAARPGGMAPRQPAANPPQASFQSRRDSASRAASQGASHAARGAPGGRAGEDQPSLALEPNQNPEPVLSQIDLILALNFPESPEDRDGFRALRRALADRGAAKLIRAAQDVLTLLSQDGIYMDDLDPDRARPEIWRRFAQGERGRAIADLGGVHDRNCLALSAARMKQDTIFRDAAHHFLRQFDRSFQDFERGADDTAIAALAETRTARAFMLLGRVTGTFD